MQEGCSPFPTFPSFPILPIIHTFLFFTFYFITFLISLIIVFILFYYILFLLWHTFYFISYLFLCAFQPLAKNNKILLVPYFSFISFSYLVRSRSLSLSIYVLTRAKGFHVKAAVSFVLLSVFLWEFTDTARFVEQRELHGDRSVRSGMVRVSWVVMTRLARQTLRGPKGTPSRMREQLSAFPSLSGTNEFMLMPFRARAPAG